MVLQDGRRRVVAGSRNPAAPTDPRAKGAEIRLVDFHNVDSLPQLIFYSADHYGTERTLKASRAGQRVWA